MQGYLQNADLIRYALEGCMEACVALPPTLKISSKNGTNLSILSGDGRIGSCRLEIHQWPFAKATRPLPLYRFGDHEDTSEALTQLTNWGHNKVWITISKLGKNWGYGIHLWPEGMAHASRLTLFPFTQTADYIAAKIAHYKTWGRTAPKKINPLMLLAFNLGVIDEVRGKVRALEIQHLNKQKDFLDDCLAKVINEDPLQFKWSVPKQ